MKCWQVHLIDLSYTGRCKGPIMYDVGSGKGAKVDSADWLPVLCPPPQNEKHQKVTAMARTRPTHWPILPSSCSSPHPGGSRSCPDHRLPTTANGGTRRCLCPVIFPAVRMCSSVLPGKNSDSWPGNPWCQAGMPSVRHSAVFFPSSLCIHASASPIQLPCALFSLIPLNILTPFPDSTSLCCPSRRHPLPYVARRRNFDCV